MTELRSRLRASFHDRRFRHEYTESFLNSSISAQIRLLRKARKMTQRELGEIIGTPQSGVSRLEDASYDGWSIATLQKMARAFDLALVVRFESFGGILGDIVRFGEAALVKPSFSEDTVFHPASLEEASSSTTILHGRFVREEGRVRTARPVTKDTTRTIQSGGSTADGVRQYAS